MKKMNKILGLAAIFSAVVFTGCKDAEYGPIENAIYIAGSPSVKAVQMPYGGTGVDADIVVQLASYAEQDVTATLNVSGSLLDAYNAKHGTTYPTVPADKISVSGEHVKVLESGAINVTIPAGDISTIAKVHIENFDMDMELSYGLVVSIVGTNSDKIHKASRMSDRLCLLTLPPPPPTPIPSPTKALIAKGADADFGTHLDNGWNLLTKSFTLELWCNMAAYNKNNRMIFSNWGNSSAGGFTEVYVRFGDANSPYNYIQVKAWNGQVQGPSGLVANTWYHWAIVWDGDKKVMTIYRDGVKHVEKIDLPDIPRADGMVQFQTLKMVNDAAWFNTTGTFSHVRFWKTARTQDEIKNNRYVTVWPKDKDLIAYWPMDKYKDGTTNVIEDITGHGHDMVLPVTKLSSWNTNVTLPVK